MANEDVMALLRSIDAGLKAVARMGGQQPQARAAAPQPPRANGNGRAPQARPPQQRGTPQVASDEDLDSQYGDPEVRFLPRDWNGEDFRQRKFSETSPEFLELMAGAFDWFATKAEKNNELYKGKPVAPFKRKDAARARGWAQRLRATGGDVIDDGYGNPETEWQ